MTSKFLATSLIGLVAAAAFTTTAVAQDKIHLLNGTVVKDVKVVEFKIRALRYKRSGSTESVESDQVAKIELGKFKDVYARGLEDAGLMLTLAREQAKAKNDVMAQLGYVGAARGFFDEGAAPEAVEALNELEKKFADGGAVADVYRLKFEYYLGIGAKGMSSAVTVAKKYETAAIGGAWPNGFTVEASFFQALSEKSSPQGFQKKLRDVINRARSSNVVVANRANIELAHSLRKTGGADEAKRIYDNIVKKDGVDDSARAGAYLGLGLINFESSNKEDAKQGLLYFLRARLETRDAWPSLHAESLYHSIQAARKWGGPESRYIMGRCRRVLFADFPNSEWAKLAKQ